VSLKTDNANISITVGARHAVPLRKDLPEGWVLKPIGEACNFAKGKKPKNTGHRSDTRTVPYINIKAFETGNPEEYAEAGNYPMCSKHDVLIVWDGARSGLVGSGASGYIGSTLAKVWSQSTENKYLFYFLKSQYGYINTNTKGVGIPHVDPGILNAIEIPIAPLLQQKLIVAEIEKQFSRLDEAVAALGRIQANLMRYKASVLKAAVEGKLTEEWRSRRSTACRAPTKDETGADLLKRILVERRKKWEEDYVKKYVGAHGHAPKDDSWKKKYKEPAAPNTSNLPKLPKGWVWATAEQLCDFITKGTTPSATKLYEGAGEVQFLKVYNLTFTGQLNYKYRPTYVRRATHEKELARSRVLPGDILMNIVGPPLGQVSIVPETLPEANINQAIARYRILGAMSVRYFAIALMSKEVMGWVIKRAKTTAGQANLTLELCRALPVPLPPLSEQKNIVEKVESRLSINEEIEASLEINFRRAKRLRLSILQCAFRGDLNIEKME
jgi:type I restriction enzyme, S subunit